MAVAGIAGPVLFTGVFAGRNRPRDGPRARRLRPWPRRRGLPGRRVPRRRVGAGRRRRSQREGSLRHDARTTTETDLPTATGPMRVHLHVPEESAAAEQRFPGLALYFGDLPGDRCQSAAPPSVSRGTGTSSPCRRSFTSTSLRGRSFRTTPRGPRRGTATSTPPRSQRTTPTRASWWTSCGRTRSRPGAWAQSAGAWGDTWRSGRRSSCRRCSPPPASTRPTSMATRSAPGRRATRCRAPGKSAASS